MLGQARHTETTASGGEAEKPVAGVVHHFAETAGEEHEYHEHTAAGGEQAAGARQKVLGTLVASGAEDGTRDRAEPAEHGGDEHLDAQQWVEAVEGHPPQGDGVEGTGEAGQGARQRKRSQLGPHRADGVGRRSALVVAHGQHGSPGTAAPEVARQGDRDEQGADADEVERERVVEVEALEQERASELRLRRVERREVARVQDVRGDRHGEGERRHSEEQALDAEGGDPDDHSGHRPDKRGGQQRHEEVGSCVHEQAGADGRAQADEGELAEADLPGPPGQDDERDGDDAVQGDVSEDDHPAVGDEERHEHDDSTDGGQQSGAAPAHLRQIAQHRRDGPHVADGDVPAEAGVVDACDAPALQQQGSEDDDEQACVDRRRARVAPEHGLLEHADGEPGSDRHGQALHAGNDGGRQWGKKGHGAGDDTKVGAQDGNREDGGDARQPRGQHPCDQRQATHGDAEKQGALVGVGCGAYRDPDVASREEPGQSEQHEWDHDHHQHVVAAEHDRPHGEVGVEGRLEGVETGQVLADQRRDPDLGRAEDLEHADGGDGEDQAGGVEEPANDDGVDEGAGGDGNGDPNRHGQEVALVPAPDHDLGDGGGQAADLDLGEVDDSARPIDKHEAHGRESVEAAEHEPEEDDAERQARGQQGAGDDPDEKRSGADCGGAASAPISYLRNHCPKQWTWVCGVPYVDGSSIAKYLPPSHGTQAPFTPSKLAGRLGSQ